MGTPARPSLRSWRSRRPQALLLQIRTRGTVLQSNILHLLVRLKRTRMRRRRRKKLNLADDEVMKKLYFGDESDQSTSSSAPKNVFREPEDKGSQPGSHPKNI